MPLTTVVLVVGGGVATLLAIQVWLLWRLTRMAAVTERLDEKVTHFGDALSLLTETSEAGFRAMAEELTRRHAGQGPTVRPRASTARLKAAARRGKSIAEIAAAESMSEGEVRLRLHLANQVGGTRPSGRRTRGETGDALRA